MIAGAADCQWRKGKGLQCGATESVRSVASDERSSSVSNGGGKGVGAEKDRVTRSLIAWRSCLNPRLNMGYPLGSIMKTYRKMMQVQNH